VISRNGERMMLTQQACCTPRSPLLYMDASEGVLHNVPSTKDIFFQAHMSDDGHRVIFDQNLLMDENFQSLGIMANPPTLASYAVIASAVSPDGQRCYGLGYHNDDFAVGDANATHPPRVLVFDCSQSVGEGNALPVLGTFDFPAIDYPSCWSNFDESQSASQCLVQPMRAITPDGSALIFMGDRKFVVVPIPATLDPVP
jgi:hypothetical protein